MRSRASVMFTGYRVLLQRIADTATGACAGALKKRPQGDLKLVSTGRLRQDDDCVPPQAFDALRHLSAIPTCALFCVAERVAHCTRVISPSCFPILTGRLNP